METSFIQQECLDEQFGYDWFYEAIPRSGWLINYNIVSLEKYNEAILYFVDDDAKNFKIKLPYYPSCLVRTLDNHGVNEYLSRKYEGQIQKIEFAKRIDTKEYNHLNTSAHEMLKIYFKNDSAFNRFIRDMKELILERKSAEAGYLELGREEVCAQDNIVNIHEYDISPDILVAVEHNIRCGSWFDVEYTGTEYKISANPKVGYPPLRVMAYDIETTKPPLKFPKAEKDKIMMISLMTESFGELIINREVVSQNIQSFEYSPKPEIQTTFRVFNEESEEALLVRFIEVIQKTRPHIITTFNGGYFDFEFVEERLLKYNLNLKQLTGFVHSHDYYECPFIIHLDCYKWVKRDSYLPMSSQGLKAATKAKLGYLPDEIDPEDMMRCAIEEPQKMASYSVSDAVATYLLYEKYVQPHIFSISSIIPLPPVQILIRGSGTLCEALLVSKAFEFNILIPTIQRDQGLQYYEGHIAENLTYVGGHVESLKAGVFRSDLNHDFNIDKHTVKMLIENMDDMLSDYTNLPDYENQKNYIIEKLLKNVGESSQKGNIYHLDVGAMYPNIILTNRLQPISIVDESICVRCDFNDRKNQCKRKMNWVSRAEFYPPSEGEIATIKKRLQNEKFYTYVNGVEKQIHFDQLPVSKQNSHMIEKIAEYSKKIYTKGKKKEEKLQGATICQREVPFYVETVRQFRDARYFYKDLYKSASVEASANPTRENRNKAIIYNSLQTAYKCILNSFYGYVMRKGSRWFSIEMAAVTCHTGGEIIKLARKLLDGIGIPLELDTDGIWAVIPECIPDRLTIGGKRVSFLSNILNYFVCKKFTNEQYQQVTQEKEMEINSSVLIPNLEDAKYEISTKNSIYFEIDGPYRTMVIPSSTEENRLLKKRYVVFNNDGKIAELKGFELKRRGELNFIKKFQEDIFTRFNDGNTLQECYDSLSEVCNYWLDIIHSKGSNMDEENIFNLFSESRSMSKEVSEYANKKSNILSTAKRLAEFLGDDILGDKLKCEFIISKFPEGEPTANRAIPIMIFKSEDRLKYLEKWLGKHPSYEIQNILDWNYYKGRFDDILRRLIVIPAHFQGIPNPLARVDPPKWANSNKNTLHFKKVQMCDFEDFRKSDGLIPVRKIEESSFMTLDDGEIAPLSSEGFVDAFFTKNKRIKTEEIEPVSFEHPKSEEIEFPEIKENDFFLLKDEIDFKEFLDSVKSTWVSAFQMRCQNGRKILKIFYDKKGKFISFFENGMKEEKEFIKKVYLGVNQKKFFEGSKVEKMCLPNKFEAEDFYVLTMNKLQWDEYRKASFFKHFAIKNLYNDIDPIFQILSESPSISQKPECLIVTSFQYQKKPVYCVSYLSDQNCKFLSELKIFGLDGHNLNSIKLKKGVEIVLTSVGDPNNKEIRTFFGKMIFLEFEFRAGGFLESFETLKRLQKDLHGNLRKLYLEKSEISKFTQIPIANINSEIRDYYLYKFMIREGVICCISDGPNHVVVRDEIYKSGYYGTCTIQVELSQSLILSIIEFESFLQNPNFPGVLRKDFLVLREFLKELIIESSKENLGASRMLDGIDLWLKRDSKLISSELREVIVILQQQYLIGLIQKMKEKQIKVVCLTKEMVFIETDKKDLSGCEEYTKFIFNEINKIPGYELLELSVLRTFERVGFLDPSIYFYITDGIFYSSNNIFKIPEEFFEKYFSDETINNEQIYDFVENMELKDVKMMLRVLSYKRDVHGLASNCYKLLKVSEFSDEIEFKPNLTVFCQNCSFENFLRHTCVRCYAEIDSGILEDECLKHLQYCWKQQVDGDKYCSICNNHEERRLKEYCGCGGKFSLTDYSEEIKKMKDFVCTKKFDDEVRKFDEYFE